MWSYHNSYRNIAGAEHDCNGNALSLVPRLPPFFPAAFFFNDTAPPEIYTLSLHDALPIFRARRVGRRDAPTATPSSRRRSGDDPGDRSEEHTSELQSRFDLVCRLLLE